MFRFYLLFLHLFLRQNLISSLIFSDCKHLILPSLCQCYHSGDESQLRCRNIQLRFVPKLPNNMHWHALDYSSNNITSIDSYVFSDIYVEKLILKSNYLRIIDTTAFNQIQNLKQLFIDHNQLKEFDPKILTSPGVSLEIFHMSYNPFKYLDLGEIFLKLPVLKEFYAVGCQLNNSSLFTLSKLNEHHHHYIEIIDLSYNNLTSLCNNLFNGFFNLIELRLNNNNIYFVDHYFIRSLNYLKVLNLAFNSIEYVPNLFSSSLENLNLSSNNIQYLNDYFISNLQSIRLVDFDSNKYLNSISSHAFCFLNILSLQKLSFRFNNISSIDTFSELLCRALDYNINQNILDLNYNVNLKCNCMLSQFEKYLTNYPDLTCTQQGQDRYFVSKSANLFSNCVKDYCKKQKQENVCEEIDEERLVLEGTCQGNFTENENSTNNESEIIKLIVWENITVNSTLSYHNGQKSIAVSIDRIVYLWIFLILLYI